jgi:hypothetical protein
VSRDIRAGYAKKGKRVKLDDCKIEFQFKEEQSGPDPNYVHRTVTFWSMLMANPQQPPK